MSDAEKLRGRRLLLAKVENDQLNLQLDGATLHILNPFTIYGAARSPSELIGRSVDGVEETQDYLSVHFTGPAELRIDLRDDAYSTAEAAVLTIEDGYIVVW